MKISKLNPQYNYYVLWDFSNADYLESSDLGISSNLVLKLSKWQAIYDKTLDLDEPYNTGFKSEGDREAFEKEGLAITLQMQAELGDSYEIYYRDQPVRLSVENLEGIASNG